MIFSLDFLFNAAFNMMVAFFILYITTYVMEPAYLYNIAEENIILFFSPVCSYLWRQDRLIIKEFSFVERLFRKG